MRIIRTWSVGLCFLSCWPCAGQPSSSPRTESIEMQAVLFSDCVQSQQKVEPQDLWPIRVVYVRIQKTGDKASVQYREFDETCKRAFTRSAERTLDHFENAKAKLKKAGMRDGATIALSESSGNDLPISFLKVWAPGLKADIYTIYLRFRWAGKMATENPDASKVLDEWRSLLQEATPKTRSGSAQDGGIAEIARNCASDWPPSLQPWIWSEAHKVMPSEKPKQDCLAHPVNSPQ
jgi:hypothetical protein